MNQLKEIYDNIIKLYINEFAIKHNLKFNKFISNTLISFGDYFVNIELIRYDIDNNIDNKIFFDYYNQLFLSQQKFDYETFIYWYNQKIIFNNY